MHLFFKCSEAKIKKTQKTNDWREGWSWSFANYTSTTRCSERHLLRMAIITQQVYCNVLDDWVRNKKQIRTAVTAAPNFVGLNATFSLSFLASVDEWTRSSYFFFQSFTWRSSSCLSQRHDAGSLSFHADGDFDAVSFCFTHNNDELLSKFNVNTINPNWLQTFVIGNRQISEFKVKFGLKYCCK